MRQKRQIKFSRKGSKHEARVGFALGTVPMIGFALFSLLPIILAIIMSFMKIKGFNFNNATWVGFDNYIKLFQDPKFGKSIKITFLEALALPFSIIISLLIATLLNRKVKGTKAFRTIYFIPFVCSVVAVSTMWKWLFEEQFGILNQIREAFGQAPIGWLSDSKYAPWSMAIINLWSGPALGIILYSAALGNVPKSYYEAASIDGASKVSQFFEITLPAVSPTTFYLLVTGTISFLQDFTRYQVILGNNAGPNNSGLTMVFYVWQMVFKYNTTMGMGIASAFSIIIGLIIGIITALYYSTSRFWVSYDY
ncbi:MAG: sugar ABC transporter permease [Bacilli bacterium]|nr:sugar ABC transporter permease [Bacilli bacterium]MBR1582069.1 sugar ABC transporter permease [Bacilli bacterium]